MTHKQPSHIHCVVCCYMTCFSSKDTFWERVGGTLGVWFRQNDLEHFGSFMTDAEDFFTQAKKNHGTWLSFILVEIMFRGEGFVSFLINWWSLKLILYYLFCQYIHYTSDVFFWLLYILVTPISVFSEMLFCSQAKQCYRRSGLTKNYLISREVVFGRTLRSQRGLLRSDPAPLQTKRN